MTSLPSRQARIVACVLALSCLHTLGATAQDLGSALARLKRSEFTIRRDGFSELARIANVEPSLQSVPKGGRRFVAYLRNNPAVATAVIELLERENLPDPAKDQLSEDSYVGNLIGIVAALSDPRAVSGLAGSIATGAMATEGLIALGPAAVPAVLDVLRAQDKHFFKRSAAAGVLGAIVAKQVGADTIAIRAGLVSALADTSMYVRRDVARALVHFRGNDIRGTMLVLATGDPAHRDRAGRQEYPVRLAALRWLAHDDSVRGRR